MHTKRQFNCKIEFSSNEIYTTQESSLDVLVLERLKQRMVGACYKRCLIYEIDKVLRKSDINIDAHADNTCYVELEFLASCVEFNIGDIVVNTRIRLLKDTNMYLTVEFPEQPILNNKVFVTMPMSEQWKTLTVNDIVPAIITEILYKTDVAIIGFSGVPFTNENKHLCNIYASLNTLMQVQMREEDDAGSVSSYRKKDWFTKSIYVEAHDDYQRQLRQIRADPAMSRIIAKLSASHKLVVDGKHVPAYPPNYGNIVGFDIDADDKVIIGRADPNAIAIIPVSASEFLRLYMKTRQSFLMLVREFKTVFGDWNPKNKYLSKW